MEMPRRQTADNSREQTSSVRNKDCEHEKSSWMRDVQWWRKTCYRVPSGCTWDPVRPYTIPSVIDIPEELHVALPTPKQNQKAICSSKGQGESRMFLGSLVFFATTDAVASACRETGLTPVLAMNSPATPELI
ncbi:Aldehyde oxidase [Sciurus carolinensis]|uniref:Aldehyde oxidase n=1 Tax=Sciurus carolinensis TaxID=30640 RepID=A0AA41N2Z3_SCICA|nr:Aldehyde oxidase [Sciurus carolinensis]